jgi:hypothetical protein
MQNFEISSEESAFWLTEAERCLVELDDLDRVLDMREATLAAQAIELKGELSAAGIDTPEALEQALAALPAYEVSAAPDLTPPRLQGKRRSMPKV